MPRKIKPPLTPEADENEMIALATNLVKQRLIEGTASSQETTHFLKLASTKARLEKEILEKQKDLIEAKTKAYRDSEDMKVLYAEAIKAMRRYNGDIQEEVDEYDEY